MTVVIYKSQFLVYVVAKYCRYSFSEKNKAIYLLQTLNLDYFDLTTSQERQLLTRALSLQPTTREHNRKNINPCIHL